MSETHALPEYHEESGLYEIRLRGHLNHRWTGWFEGMTITLEEGGTTLLTGPVVDQSELHGLIKKVRDLGMPLVSVSPVEPSPSVVAHPAASGVKSQTGVDGLFTPNQTQQGE